MKTYNFVLSAALVALLFFSPLAKADDNQAPATDTPTDVQKETPLSRWLEVDALSFTMRYRNSFDTNGQKVFDNIQQRTLASGKLKLDKEGKYFIGFRAASGRYFNWSFADFSGLDYKQAANTDFAHLNVQKYYANLTAYFADPNAALILRSEVARGWEFYIRDLYLSATPVTGMTLEFGAIPIERGVGSEITTYDEDGYMSGERIRLKYPNQIYLDQVEFTSSYVGDVFTPNFFDRYDRLTQSNYRQILGEKHFGSRLKVSTDYTWLVGTDTIREAALVKTSETKVLDSARVELYQRLNQVQLPGYLAKSGNGWAFTGTKHFGKRATIDAGYADIDFDDGVYSGSGTLAAFGFALNGDSYQVGKRFFGRANVSLLPGISVFGFYTHQIDSKATPLTYSYTRQNLNFGMQFDFKAMLERGHIL